MPRSDVSLKRHDVCFASDAPLRGMMCFAPAKRFGACGSRFKMGKGGALPSLAPGLWPLASRD
jgi:hypothetical protein